MVYCSGSVDVDGGHRRSSSSKIAAAAVGASTASRPISVRHRDDQNPFEKDRLKPYEIVLAIFLVLAGLGGLGMLWYYNYGGPKSGLDGVDSAKDGRRSIPLSRRSRKSRLRNRCRPKLAGVWELRSDDGLSGSLVLGQDGARSSSSADASKIPDFQGRWNLDSVDGNRYVLEFGPETRGLDSYKVTIELTSPDAFTLVETIRSGVPIREQRRFVRTGLALQFWKNLRPQRFPPLKQKLRDCGFERAHGRFGADNPISGNPDAGRTTAAAVAIECPQCGTQLRLLRPATVHTPIACCICEATFYLQPVATAPISDSAIATRAQSTDKGDHPTEVCARPIMDAGPRRAAAADQFSHAAAAEPGTRSAPGDASPCRIARSHARGFRTRWMESVLGTALVLLLVVAACAGGFVLFRTIWKDQTPVPTNATEEATDVGPIDDATASGPPTAAGSPKTDGTG